MRSYMVGRQPIFNAKLAVHGYELLFRGTDRLRPAGDSMTSQVLVSAGLDLGLSSLVGDKPAFVNATRPFLVGELDIPFSPQQVVVEVLEDIDRDTEVLAGCRRLVRSGYALALDDYVLPEEDDPLLALASFVKLDVLALTPCQLEEAVRRCAGSGRRLVAEKVETVEQLRACQELAFDLFQGYVFSHPEVVEGRSLSPSQLTCLRLLERLCDSNSSAGKLEGILREDPALTHRFLRAAGAGAARGLFRRLRSVRDAMVLLGERRVRAWLVLMLLAGNREGPDELLVMALTRARMAELMLLPREPGLHDAAFTVGLLSALDLLLQAPLPAIVEELSLASDLEEALLTRSGRLGAVLSDVVTWERDGAVLPLRSGIGPEDLERCYLQALAWAVQTCGLMGGAD
jgi:c-di-GMP-related signal transduction protein